MAVDRSASACLIALGLCGHRPSGRRRRCHRRLPFGSRSGRRSSAAPVPRRQRRLARQQVRPSAAGCWPRRGAASAAGASRQRCVSTAGAVSTRQRSRRVERSRRRAVVDGGASRPARRRRVCLGGAGARRAGLLAALAADGSGLAAAACVRARRAGGAHRLGHRHPASTSMPNSAATCGSAGARRLTVDSRSSLDCVGLRGRLAPWLRTGENAAASSSADQRSRSDIGGERCGGRFGERLGQLGREPDAGLGRLRRELERTDDAADAEGGSRCRRPQLESPSPAWRRAPA